MGVLESFRDTIPHAARVLVINGETGGQNGIVSYLNQHDLRATAANTRVGAMRMLASREPDLILLDLHFGHESGLDMLRDIRKRTVVPVILTADNRGDVDCVACFEMGADDFMATPVDLRELLARVKAAIRRRHVDTLHPIKRAERFYMFNGWVLDQRNYELRDPNNNMVTITKSEFAMLSAFLTAPGRALSREHLLQATRVHEDVYDRSINVQVLRLRRKLEANPRTPQLIRTERGVGYTFVADVTAR